MIKLLLLLFTIHAHAYQIFGTTGSIMSSMTQAERDALTPLAPGVMIYNETSGTYNLWNGIIWSGIGSGGSVTRNWYNASVIAGNSVNNTAIPYFTTIDDQKILPAECGVMVNDNIDGMFLTVQNNSSVVVTLNTYNIGPAYAMGISINPTAAELDMSFLAIPAAKQGCKVETLGTTSNAQSCTVSYMAVPGDTIYVHANPGQVWSNNTSFSVRFTCMADASITVSAPISGPPVTTVGAVAIWNDTTGTSLTQTDYTFPLTDGASNQILQTDGTGLVTWVNIPSSIITPNPSVINRPALYGNATGTVLIEAPYTMPVIVGTPGQLLTTDGLGAAAWVNAPVTYALPDDLGQPDKVFLSDGTDVGKWLAYGVPGQILMQTTANTVGWAASPPTIVTPNPTVINRPALFGDLIGGTLIEALYTLPVVDGTADQLLQTDGLGAVTWRTLPPAPPATHLIFSPAAIPANGQVAITSTAGFQLFRITAAADIDLNIIPFSGTLTDGMEVTLLNISAFYITMLFNDSSSGAIVNGDARIRPKGMLTLIYSLADDRWIEKSRSF